jgi:hypothetical protein
MENQVEMLLKTSDFYIRESQRVQAKLKKAKTEKEKIKILADLQSLQKKIAFEIAEINKLLDSQDQ